MAAEIFFAEEGTVWTGRYHKETQTGLTGTTVTVVNNIGPISDPTMAGVSYDQVNDVSVWVNDVEETVVSYTGAVITITSTLIVSDVVVVKYCDWVQSRPCEITNIEISGGVREVEDIQAFHGCVIKDEKPQEIFETSITAIKNDLDWTYMWLGTPISGSAITPTYPINLVGGQTKEKWAIVYYYEKAVGALTEAMRIILMDAACTEAPWTNAADGYIEQSITFKSVPTDYQEQYTNDQLVASPLAKVLSGAGL